MKATLAKLLLAFFSLLPLASARILAKVFTKLCLLYGKSSLELVSQKNLALTQRELSTEEATALTKRTVFSTLSTALEMPIIWRQDNQWLNSKIVSSAGSEFLTAAMDNGNGVIVLCPHIGNWEVFGRKLAEFGPTTSLYQPPKMAFLEETVRLGREKSGAKLVPTNRSGIAKLIRALKSGEITGILPDQQPDDGSGLYVPFFGVPAYTMTLVHRLIQKTDCQVVLGYALRTAGGFQIIFKPVDPSIYSPDAIESVVALSRAVESALEEDVSQYQWAYKRFRKQPDGLSPYNISTMT